MRQLLVTVLLIIAVIAIYANTIGGPEGTQARVRDSGGKINGTIESINP